VTKINKLAKPFFQTCKEFIKECCVENLPKLGVEASLYYAGIVRSYESCCRANEVDINKASEQINIAKTMLEKAREMCAQGFENADNLLRAVEGLIKMLRKKWYEEINAEEIAATKAVMVRDSEGIATHFDH